MEDFAGWIKENYESRRHNYNSESSAFYCHTNSFLNILGHQAPDNVLNDTIRSRRRQSSTCGSAKTFEGSSSSAYMLVWKNGRLETWHSSVWTSENCYLESARPSVCDMGRMLRLIVRESKNPSLGFRKDMEAERTFFSSAFDVIGCWSWAHMHQITRTSDLDSMAAEILESWLHR